MFSDSFGSGVLVFGWLLVVRFSSSFCDSFLFFIERGVVGGGGFRLVGVGIGNGE